MKLYYAPGACSLSPHIVAKEGGIPLELSRVTFGADGRTTEDGEDFYAVNPKGGYVPALRLDSGDVLMEGSAIILYLADQAEVPLTPAPRTPEYYRMLEWIGYVSTELHKGFSPLYDPAITDERTEAQKRKIMSRLPFVEAELGKHPYVVGTTFSVADAYLYAILRWTKRFEMSLEDFPNILDFMARMDGRDGVKAALSEEGLEPFSV